LNALSPQFRPVGALVNDDAEDVGDAVGGAADWSPRSDSASSKHNDTQSPVYFEGTFDTIMLSQFSPTLVAGALAIESVPAPLRNIIPIDIVNEKHRISMHKREDIGEILHVGIANVSAIVEHEVKSLSLSHKAEYDLGLVTAICSTPQLGKAVEKCLLLIDICGSHRSIVMREGRLCAFAIAIALIP
jgi:hypothetical protein